MSEINLKSEDRNPGEVESPNKSIKKKKSIKERLSEIFKDPKKRLIFILSLGAFLIIIFGIGLYLLTHDSNTSKPNQKEDKNNTATEQAILYPAALDGVMTDQASAEKHPLAIIVENHPDARPQSGLSKASVVYEAIAEGGITRFMGIFGTNEVEKVGPVRSARTFFVDWAHGYNAYFAHVGGNIDALDKIPVDKILDLDQFRYSAPYWRERSSGLATEHTMYTSTTKLREEAEKNQYSKANNFNIMRFKDEPAETAKSTLPEEQEINVDFSNASYNIIFKYDKATNSYKRFMAGQSHTDKNTKDQINPKNVIVMTVKRQATVTRINEPGWNMDTIGTGKAEIFIDGKQISGTWKKPSASDRELFYDDKGNEVTFNRGQFWICVVPPDVTPTVK